MLIYRMLVRRKVLAIFRSANSGDWQAMIDALHERFTYRFVGDTPLGGERSTKAAMNAWWQRLYRLFPGAVFHPQTVVVEGPPWNTRVMTYVTITGSVPRSDGAGSAPYQNEFMQMMTIRWGRITKVMTIEDTQRFAAILPVMRTAGMSDAAAAPISD